MNKRLELNRENYFSREADSAYMSVSQFESFYPHSEHGCQLRAYHRYVTGETQRHETPEQLEGRFAHALFEGEDAFSKFLVDNEGRLLAKRGQASGQMLKAFADLEASCREVMAIPQFMERMAGEHEIIMTGNLAGADWKIMVDVINDLGGFFSDFKCMASLYQPSWRTYRFDEDGNMDMDGEYEKNLRVPFWEKYDYWRRFAIYREIIRQNTGKNYRVFMPCISKESPVDWEVMEFENEGRFLIEIRNVEEAMPEILRAKQGWALKECGLCSTCRKTRKREPSKIASSLF